MVERKPQTLKGKNKLYVKRTQRKSRVEKKKKNNQYLKSKIHWKGLAADETLHKKTKGILRHTNKKQYNVKHKRKN